MFNGSSCQCQVLQIVVNQSVSHHYHPFILFGVGIGSCLKTVFKLQARRLLSPDVFCKAVTDSEEWVVWVFFPFVKHCKHFSDCPFREMFVDRWRQRSCSFQAARLQLGAMRGRWRSVACHPRGDLGTAAAAPRGCRSLWDLLLLLKQQTVSKEGWGFRFSLLPKCVRLFI